MTGHDLIPNTEMTEDESRAELHAEFAASATEALFDHLAGLVGAGRMSLVDAYRSYTKQTDELHTIREKENAK